VVLERRQRPERIAQRITTLRITRRQLALAPPRELALRGKPQRITPSADRRDTTASPVICELGMSGDAA